MLLALLLASCVPAADGQAGSAVPFKYSTTSDLENQGLAIEYFESKYYTPDNRWSLSDEHLQELRALVEAAMSNPVLALAAAQVLYLFAWFRRSGEIMRENIITAAQLFERSIPSGGCSARSSNEEWIQGGCDIRCGQSAILYNWLGETDNDTGQAQAYRDKSFAILEFLLEAPRFAEVKKSWAHPLDMNFNQLRFPGVPSRPIWDASQVPLARFMEENFPVFRAELDAIVNDPRDLYEHLRRADGSLESLATPGGWDAVRIVRYGHWFDLFCEMAPRTCALLRTRPELVNCPYVNTNYYKLHPNAHLKPHFGNAPRLTAHLSVIAPEPMRSGISVGTARALWVEGKAMVIDDTYPHAVSNWGTQPRYVLATWFCHPCDENHDHGQTCPEKL